MIILSSCVLLVDLVTSYLVWLYFCFVSESADTLMSFIVFCSSLIYPSFPRLASTARSTQRPRRDRQRPNSGFPAKLVRQGDTIYKQLKERKAYNTFTTRTLLITILYVGASIFSIVFCIFKSAGRCSIRM